MKKLPFNFKKISMKHVYIFIILVGFSKSLYNIIDIGTPSKNSVMEILTYKPFIKTSETQVKEIQPIYSESGLSLDVKIKKSFVEETKRYSNVEPIIYKMIIEKISNIEQKEN